MNELHSILEQAEKEARPMLEQRERMTQGTKDDDGKLPLELIPEEFIRAVGEVYKVGLHYGRENWKKGLTFRRMKGAMMRHMNSFYLGEDFDTKSPTQHHLAAVAFYCAAIIYFQARGRKDLDDRDIA